MLSLVSIHKRLELLGPLCSCGCRPGLRLGLVQPLSYLWVIECTFGRHVSTLGHGIPQVDRVASGWLGRGDHSTFPVSSLVRRETVPDLLVPKHQLVR